MPAESGDPRDVRSLAISAKDLVAAVETNRTSDREAVLRITPPFSGRMRARLHVVQGTDPGGSPRPVCLDPEAVLTADAPAYPRPSATEDALRADPDEEYTVDRHHEYHAEAVAAWREALLEAVRDRVCIDTPRGRTEVEIAILG